MYVSPPPVDHVPARTGEAFNRIRMPAWPRSLSNIIRDPHYLSLLGTKVAIRSAGLVCLRTTCTNQMSLLYIQPQATIFKIHTCTGL